MSEYIVNPVYKLMMDKLQLLLINVLIRSIFLNTKVSQGNEAMLLSYDGIFIDQFVTQSLLSPMVKEF